MTEIYPNQFYKARHDLFEPMGLMETTNRLKVLADELNMLDLLNPTGRQIGITAEIIWRIKSVELEPIDMVGM